jgi:hypothetical protein
VLVIFLFVIFSQSGGGNNFGITNPFDGVDGSKVPNGRSLDRSSSMAVEQVFRSIGSGQLQGEVDQLLSKYTMALESEECMDRIICELGVKASALPSKELFFSMVDMVMPPSELLSSSRMGVFKTAATEAFTMDECRMRFRCNPPTVVQEDFTGDTLQFRLPADTEF